MAIYAIAIGNSKFSILQEKLNFAYSKHKICPEYLKINPQSKEERAYHFFAVFRPRFA